MLDTEGNMLRLKQTLSNLQKEEINKYLESELGFQLDNFQSGIPIRGATNKGPKFTSETGGERYMEQLIEMISDKVTDISKAKNSINFEVENKKPQHFLYQILYWNRL